MQIIKIIVIKNIRMLNVKVCTINWVQESKGLIYLHYNILQKTISKIAQALLKLIQHTR